MPGPGQYNQCYKLKKTVAYSLGVKFGKNKMSVSEVPGPG